MSALDTFEWIIRSTIKNPTPEEKRYITERRDYLTSLRSEDEQQRYVEDILREINRSHDTKK